MNTTDTVLRSAVVLIAALATPIRAQVTERVSVDSASTQGNDDSFGPALSATGRFAAFSSQASNLVPGDTNGLYDIFVRDSLLALTERVSVGPGGAEGDDHSYKPVLSADGRHVAFWSPATNLVPGDTNGSWDVFVRDRQLGVTERVSVDSAGTQGNNNSWEPALSADGRYVAFWSVATNLVPGDTNEVYDVFVRDRQLGITERVSVDSSGAEADSHSYQPSISADGRHVAFWSHATNLVPGDGNGFSDVFVRDRQLGLTRRVSVDSAGQGGNQDSFYPSISADGRYVAFHSLATDLVPGDTNTFTDVFVRDRELGITERVSVDSGGGEADGSSYEGSISADGRHVAFWSGASDLVAGDTNAATDAFVHGCDSVGTIYCTANPSSTGAPAELSAACSTSSAEGSLALDAVPVPNQFGIFFHGANQSQVAFGNGFLCATGDITRGAVVSPSGSLATYVYDNSDAKHSLAAYVGTTRNFQYWFRDPAGGGAFFNTSNAISLAVLP